MFRQWHGLYWLHLVIAIEKIGTKKQTRKF